MKKRVSTGITMDAMYAQFLAEKQAKGLSKDSIRNYNLAFRLFVEQTNTTYVSDITQQTIVNWVCTMQDKGIKATSINHYLQSIRTIINYCIDNEYITHKVHITLVKSQEDGVKFYTDAEVRQLLQKPSKSDSFVCWRTYTAVSIMLATGARASTVTNIHISDLDFNSRLITYSHTKNKKAQQVPMSQQLCKVLKDYLNMWERTTTNDYLICNGAEGQITPNGLLQALRDYCNDRGVRCLGQHAIRHTFARTWIINGGSVFALQHMLGHSDLTMTKHYVTLFGQDLQDGFEQYSALDNAVVSNRVERIKRK